MDATHLYWNGKAACGADVPRHRLRAMGEGVPDCVECAKRLEQKRAADLAASRSIGRIPLGRP